MESLFDFQIGYLNTVVRHLAGAFLKDYEMPMYYDVKAKMNEKTPQDNRTAEEIKNDLLLKLTDRS